MDQVAFAKLLRAVAKAVEGMSPAELEELTSTLTERRAPRAMGAASKKPPARPPREKLDQEQLAAMAARLSQSPSREEGRMILDDLRLSRRELTALAKLQNIYISKEDNIAALEAKLLESFVGARLNSMAIRGR